MKPEEALEILKEMQFDVVTRFNRITPASKAVEIAIKALEKQIPKEPNGDFVKMFNRFVHMCPTCGTRIADHVLFCHECGQALLWEE